MKIQVGDRIRLSDGASHTIFGVSYEPNDVKVMLDSPAAAWTSGRSLSVVDYQPAMPPEPPSDIASETPPASAVDDVAAGQGASPAAAPEAPPAPAGEAPAPSAPVGETVAAQGEPAGQGAPTPAP